MQNRPSVHALTSGWSCGGASVLGASHLRTGTPNQDAIAWWPQTVSSEQSPLLVLAIADGHGSAKSFRSHLGSALAVQIALAQFQSWFRLDQPQQLTGLGRDLEVLQQQIRQELPQQIVTTWQQQVRQRLQQDPFSDAEVAKLTAKEGATAVALVSQYPEIAYGATLLTVMVTPGFIVYLQLGDGDILCVDKRGQPHRPLADDPSLIANETTSLCMPQAWKYARVQVQPTQSGTANLILLSTDGYANSFISESDFCQIGPDYYQMIREQGFVTVLDQLAPILQEATQQGSGDDITLGLISCIQPSQSPPSTLRRRTDGLQSSTPQSLTSRPATTQPLSTQRPTRYSHSTQPGTSSTQFQTPIPSSSPVNLPDLPSVPAGDSPDQQIHKLQRANQRLKKHIQVLRLGLGISLGFAFFSLAGAGYLFWRYLQLKNQPNPPVPPSSSPLPDRVTPLSPSPAGQPPAAPLSPQPTSSPTTNSPSPSSSPQAGDRSPVPASTPNTSPSANPSPTSGVAPVSPSPTSVTNPAPSPSPGTESSPIRQNDRNSSP